jgi:hypothetical protein
MNDPIALKSLAVRTSNCKTLDEFVAELQPSGYDVYGRITMLFLLTMIGNDIERQGRLSL